MKKLVVLILSALTLLAFTACGNDAVTVDPDAPETPPTVEETEPEPEENGDTGPAVGTGPGGTFTVAVNMLNGDALAGWTNAVGNAQMRDLMHYGGSTVVFTSDAEFIVNPIVVSNVEEEENEDGSKTWTITINEGLRFSDGTEFNAQNFVFSYLFWSAPHFASAGAENNLGNTQWAGFREIKGIGDWLSGEADVLTGVRLIDDYTFSVTIDAETDGEANFPYFYE